MKNMKEYIKKNKFNISIMLGYMILSFVIMLFHEQWRDEAQSWLIARDLGFLDIIKQMKYEGHPFLWYYILAIFAKLGFPYITVKIVSWLITTISAYLILKKSPFSKWVRVLIIFTTPFIYWFSAIARSYCLIPLAIVLIAITYKERKEKPIRYVLSIILLANTHVIMFALVGMLLLVFYVERLKEFKNNTSYENRKIIYSFIIAVILLAITIIPMFTSLTMNKEVDSNFEFNIIKFTDDIEQVTKEIEIYLFGTRGDIFYAIMIVIVIFMLAYQFKYYPINATIFLISLIYQFIIYIYIYPMSEQRASTILCIVLLFAWIQKYSEIKDENHKLDEKLVGKILIILLCVNIVFGGEYILEDIKGKYSRAKETAKYISENINDGKFISTDIAYASSIIPFMEGKQKETFWNPKSEEYFTYVTWDENSTPMQDISELKGKIKNNFSPEEKLYLLYAFSEEKINVQELEEGYITLVYESISSIRKENYKIYEINDKLIEELEK